MTLDQFSHATFVPLVGSDFRLSAPGAAPGQVTLELVEAALLPDGGRPAGLPQRTPFSLVFRAIGHIQLPQRIYRVEHTALGAFDLFLVPIGPDANGLRYEAVFN